MNVSTPLRAAALMLLAGLALTACGGASSSAEPTKTMKTFASKSSGSDSTPTALPTATSTRKLQANGGFYVDVYDLQHEVVAAGGTRCEDFKYWGAVAFADGTISCDEGMLMLNVFPSPENLEKNKAKEIQEGNANTYDFSTTWLQGMNWTIRGKAEELPALQKKLGGEIVTFSYGPSHR